jgi:hypothetical protein
VREGEDVGRRPQDAVAYVGEGGHRCLAIRNTDSIKLFDLWETV